MVDVTCPAVHIRIALNSGYSRLLRPNIKLNLHIRIEVICWIIGLLTLIPTFLHRIHSATFPKKLQLQMV